MPACCRIVAHRGYARQYPENTLIAFRAALEAGADAIELDVQFAGDGTPMVIHDADIGRVSGQRAVGRKGQVRHMDAATLSQVSVHEPGRFGQRFAGETIPSLASACDFLAALSAPLVFIEIKQETLTLHQLPAMIQRVVQDSAALAGQRVIISFLDEVLQQANSFGKVPVGWVLPRFDTATIERARTLEPAFVFCDRTRLPVGIGALPRGNWQWVVYEVTDPGEARSLHQRGVDYIETMAVGDMRLGLDAR